MVERAQSLGVMFRDGLERLNSPLIMTVRGKGLLNAIIIDESKTGGHSAWDLCMLMKEKGLLVSRHLKIETYPCRVLTPTTRQNLRTKTSFG